MNENRRNIYFSPALAPYRVDYYNDIYNKCNCDIYFLQRSLTGQLFSTGKLEEMCDFPVHFIKSVSLYGRFFPFGVAKMIISSRPEFVVVPEYSITCLWVIFLRFVLFRKFRIISQCDDSYSMIVDGGFSKLHDLARRICIRFVDEVILVDNKAVDLMRERYSKGVWMPIIRDERRFPSYSSIVHRKSLPDCLKVLFVGRLSPEKNLGILLEACARLSVPYKLVLVGDGPQMQELRQRAAALNVNVEFVGSRQGNDLLAWYYAADVFVLPSLIEPFGAVTNEALLCGCPVCVSNRAGSSCLISEGRNGYTFDPLSAEELKDRIEALGRNGNSSHSSLMPVTYRECFDNCIKECRMLDEMDKL